MYWITRATSFIVIVVIRSSSLHFSMSNVLRRIVTMSFVLKCWSSLISKLCSTNYRLCAWTINKTNYNKWALSPWMEILWNKTVNHTTCLILFCTELPKQPINNLERHTLSSYLIACTKELFYSGRGVDKKRQICLESIAKNFWKKCLEWQNNFWNYCILIM